MSHIKKVVETLGGWKPALRMVKPSTSTFTIMVILIVLVVFFPENQWGWGEDGKPPSAKETETSTTQPTTVESETSSPVSSETVLPSSLPPETSTMAPQTQEDNPVEQAPSPVVPDENGEPAPPQNRNDQPPVVVTITQYPRPDSSTGQPNKTTTPTPVETSGQNLVEPPVSQNGDETLQTH